MNLLLWDDHLHDGLLPVLERLKAMGYDGVEVPMFQLDEDLYSRWGKRFKELGLESTAVTIRLEPDNPISPDAKVDQGVELHGPCFIDDGAVVKAGARVLPYAVIGRQTHVAEGAVVDGSIVWPNGWIGPEAVVRSSILGRNCHIGRNVTIETPVQLGDKTAVTDYSRL